MPHGYMRQFVWSVIWFGRSHQSASRSVAAACSVSDDHALVLTGYEVQVTPEGDDCVVEVDPEPVQHRRRMSARVRGPEVEEVLLRPL